MQPSFLRKPQVAGQVLCPRWGTSHQHKDTREEGAHKLINARLTLYVSCTYNGARHILPLSLSLSAKRGKKRERERVPLILSVLGGQEEEGSKARKKKQEEGGEA